MSELLLELLSEEIPARMQARAADDLKRLVTEGLKANGLDFTDAKAFVTPRRLTLVVEGLPEKTPDVSEERRGPRTDAPEKAQEGFRKSLPQGATVEERETPKGTFFFAFVDKKGEAAAGVVHRVINEAVATFGWPKSMRWADNQATWVRPLHNVLVALGGEALHFQTDLGPKREGAKAQALYWNNQTSGHRFMAPGAFAVTGFADYEKKLRDAYVLIDREERKTKILKDAKALCETEGLVLKDDPGLLEEVAGLVEWPVVLMGTIDEAFMEVPDEVLTISMKKHQKYFSVLDREGRLAPKFVVVANRETADGGTQVVAGNERVLRARLSDAKFFWEQDRKTSLAAKAPALKDRVFHAKLGTLDEKVDRMQALAADLCAHIPDADKDRVRSAARLAKADLSTGMVGEFADLQGVMGSYYARFDGESEDVADAIAEHYAPQGPGDACPSKPVSIAVSMADKIDTLVGFFAIDEKPTGSKDPYALRRAALGVIRLIIENRLRVPLAKAFETAHRLYEREGSVTQDLLAFFADRLKVHLRVSGVKHDHIDAVFALKDENGQAEDDLVRLLARVGALSEFLGSEDGENLLTAYRRAANILKIEEKKDAKSYAEAPDAQALQQDEEKALHKALEDAAPKIEASLASEDFASAMTVLAGLRQPVDAFFDHVTVNADDPALRVNRLKLLSLIRASLGGVADFSKIEG